jgi:adenine-specific DNA methylase
MDTHVPEAADLSRHVLADAPAFIERQLPVSLLSKESYRERMARTGQTLTVLGSYWKGRKPLVLVRAVLLGLLLPATDDPTRDREIFLKLMLMDAEGLRRRKSEPVKAERAAELLPLALHAEAFEDYRGKLRWRRSLPRVRRDELELLAFDAMGTDEKLDHCSRTEEMSASAWDAVWPAVNAHLAPYGVQAGSLPELVEGLGLARFGRRPRVGDPFCGGGSIPFEAARIGCDVHASDLNPVACMLTWGALNILGAPQATRDAIAEAQRAVIAAVDAELREAGFEHDGGADDIRLPADAPTRWPHGWSVDRRGEPMASDEQPYAVLCPKSGWHVPLLSTLRVHEPTRTVLRLVPDARRKTYRLHPMAGTNDADWEAAATGTVVWTGSDFVLRHDPGTGPQETRIANRAKAFLYCLETLCPRTGWMVPLLPTREIAPKHGVIARLEPDAVARRFRIEVDTGVDDATLAAAKADTTVRDSALDYVLDGQRHVTPVATLRGDVALRTRYASPAEEAADRARFAAAPNKHKDDAANGLRPWSRKDVAPLPGDVWQERLYCIQWVRPDGTVFFAGVGPKDEAREAAVRAAVERNLAAWQREGLVPDMPIEPGVKTDEPIRTRGWTHWHHLFTPRQLHQVALWQLHSRRRTEAAALALDVGRLVNSNSRLCRWRPAAGGGVGAPTGSFDNQALNTLFNYPARTVAGFDTLFPSYDLPGTPFPSDAVSVQSLDARDVQDACDIWVSDPPYADAVVYHEITEFFIGWLRKGAPAPLDGFTWASKRALAIQGAGQDFRKAMVEAYGAMARHMPANGVQVVMFTHQDTAVWADLAAILWAAGLQVTAGWCIVTETDTKVQAGNFVQGTVLLVLRQRSGDAGGYLARLQRPIELAVQRQLDAMRDLNPQDNPDFGDTDFQLGAYAAALKELTAYARIDGRPVAEEVLTPAAQAGTQARVTALLDRARSIASDFLLPDGLPRAVWADLKPAERFYAKGLELEREGEVRYAAFQELARGFGVHAFRDLLASADANAARLKTAGELRARNLRRAGAADRAEDQGLEDFAGGLVRHALYGVHLALQQDDVRAPLPWFAANLADYWGRQSALVAVLEYIASITTAARAREAEAADRLAGAVRNHRP